MERVFFLQAHESETSQSVRRLQVAGTVERRIHNAACGRVRSYRETACTAHVTLRLDGRAEQRSCREERGRKNGLAGERNDSSETLNSRTPIYSIDATTGPALYSCRRAAARV